MNKYLAIFFTTILSISHITCGDETNCQSGYILEDGVCVLDTNHNNDANTDDSNTDDSNTDDSNTDPNASTEEYDPNFDTIDSSTELSQGNVALVVGFNDIINSNHHVDVMSLDSVGRVLNQQLHFSIPDIPEAIAVNSNGTKAAITWGISSRDYGITLLSIRPDGTSASLIDHINLGGSWGPRSIAFIDDDHIALGILGVHPRGSAIKILQATTSLEEIQHIAIPDSPRTISPVPNHSEVLVLQQDLLAPANGHSLYSLYYDSQSWAMQKITGPYSEIALDLQVHPSGETAYIPIQNADDLYSSTNLNPTGLLQGFTRVSATQWDIQADDFLTPGFGSYQGLHPNGRYGVLADEVAMRDPGTTNVVYPGYLFHSINYDEETGTVKNYAEAHVMSTDAYLIDSINISAFGIVLTTERMDLYSDINKRYRFSSYKLNRYNRWQKFSDSAWINGPAIIAIGPYNN